MAQETKYQLAAKHYPYTDGVDLKYLDGLRKGFVKGFEYAVSQTEALRKEVEELRENYEGMSAQCKYLTDINVANMAFNQADEQWRKQHKVEDGEDFIHWYMRYHASRLSELERENASLRQPPPSQEQLKPHGFCENHDSNCTMNYCDENGCQERKRNLVELKDRISVEPTSPGSTPFQKFSLIPEEPRSIATDGTELKEDIDVSKTPDFFQLVAGKYIHMPKAAHARIPIKSVNAREEVAYVAGCERIWGDYVSPLQSRIAELEAENEELRKKGEALQKFKDYVHGRLDKMTIEKDPESPHKEKGCRIGGRLDIIEKIVDDHTCKRCGWRRRDHSSGGRCYRYSDQDTDYFYDDKFFQPLPSKPKN